jgi:hypothetical protein
METKNPLSSVRLEIPPGVTVHSQSSPLQTLTPVAVTSLPAKRVKSRKPQNVASAGLCASSAATAQSAPDGMPVVSKSEPSSPFVLRTFGTQVEQDLPQDTTESTVSKQETHTVPCPVSI